MPASLRFAPIKGRQVEPRPLKPDEIHIWTCSLDLPPDDVDRLASVLSAEELGRADRFRFERHRSRYRASWGLVRSLLGVYSERPPRELTFVYGPKGKPSLEENAAALEFNLSHSADQLMLGIQRGHRLGVDLERLRSVDEWQRIARRSFAPGEVTELEALPEPQRLLGFFNCWTRKEALIKAHGEGVFISLDRFQVSLRPDARPELTLLDGDPTAARDWSLHHLEPAPGYVGALATDLPRPSRLRAWAIDPLSLSLPGLA
jgi:4'-phosphopantetheinyl transferase